MAIFYSINKIPQNMEEKTLKKKVQYTLVNTIPLQLLFQQQKVPQPQEHLS